MEPSHLLNLAFDARMARHSGIGTYIRSLLEILTKDPDLDLTLYGDLTHLADYNARKILADFPIYSVREQVFFPALLKKNPCGLLHVPHYNAPLGYGGKLVVTVHDLIHLKFPPSRLAYLYARGMLQAVCGKADLVLTDSLNTKKDILELLGVPEKKIRVIYLGFGNNLEPRVLDEEEDPQYPKDGFMLYVGNVRATKNIPLLVEAFVKARALDKDMRIVIAGKNFMQDYTAAYQGSPTIRFTGEVSMPTLRTLFRNARFFVFPSLYEGFGLPPLEAMSRGLPVISSNAASLPEVLGDAALTFDPNNSEQLAGHMVRLWKDSALRKSLAQKGLDQAKKFTWEKCAAETKAAYLEVLRARR